MELTICFGYVVGAVVSAFLVGRFATRELAVFAAFWPVMAVALLVFGPLYAMAHLGYRLRGRNASNATDDQT